MKWKSTLVNTTHMNLPNLIKFTSESQLPAKFQTYEICQDIFAWDINFIKANLNSTTTVTHVDSRNLCILK